MALKYSYQRAQHLCLKETAWDFFCLICKMIKQNQMSTTLSKSPQQRETSNAMPSWISLKTYLVRFLLLEISAFELQNIYIMATVLKLWHRRMGHGRLLKEISQHLTQLPGVSSKAEAHEKYKGTFNATLPLILGLCKPLPHTGI